MSALDTLKRGFLSLTGYGGPSTTPSSGRLESVIANARAALNGGQPQPITGANGLPLPVAQHFPQAQALPPIPAGTPQAFANRYTSQVTAAPLDTWVHFRSTWLLRG